MPSLSDLQPKKLATSATTTLDDYPTALRAAPGGGAFAVATASGAVRVVDHAGATRWERKLHAGSALSSGALALAWAPRVLATGGQDGRVCLVSPEDGTSRVSIDVGAWAEHLAWSHDGERLAIGAGRVARIVSATGAPIAEARAQGSTIAALAWSPRGDLLATASYGGVRLFDGASGALARHLAWKGSLVSMAWSPDGRVIACGSQDASVHFWRLPGGEDSEMQGYPNKPKALAFDAASGWLATGGDRSVCMWRFAGKGPEGTRPRLLERHAAPVSALAFHPRKGVLASGAADGTVCLWSVDRTRPTAETRLPGAIAQLAWSADGSALAVTADPEHFAIVSF